MLKQRSILDIPNKLDCISLLNFSIKLSKPVLCNCSLGPSWHCGFGVGTSLFIRKHFTLIVGKWGSLSGTLIPKHSPALLQGVPPERHCKLVGCCPRVTSWSIYCPHVITMWVSWLENRFSSVNTLRDKRSLYERFFTKAFYLSIKGLVPWLNLASYFCIKLSLSNKKMVDPF